MAIAHALEIVRGQSYNYMIAIEKSCHDDIYTKDCCILTCHAVQYSVETADIETGMYKCIPTENINIIIIIIINKSTIISD